MNIFIDKYFFGIKINVMDNNNYIKKLEERIEHYEGLFESLNGNEQKDEIKFSNLNDQCFCKNLVGIQPVEFDKIKNKKVLGYAIRANAQIHSSPLSVHTNLVNKLVDLNESTSHIKNKCLNAIINECENFHFTYDLKNGLEDNITGLYTLMLQQSNGIALQTRRGSGNVVWCSKGLFERFRSYSKAKSNIDGSLLLGRFTIVVDVYVPYEIIIIGYKGSIAKDAGIVVCPITDSKTTVHFIDGWEKYYRVISVS